MKIENIKFKAKRLDNGEWVKGDLVHSTSYVGISYPSDEFSDVPIVHRVDPETVCQFTGLKDYENQDIYEGDILAEKRYPEFEVGYINCTFAAAYVGDDKFIYIRFAFFLLLGIVSKLLFCVVS